MSIFDFLYQDIAIDLGTVNTLIYMRGRGIVLNQPSIIAFDSRTGKVISIGSKAEKMHEKTHSNITTIQPLADGVIADYEAAEALIRGFIKEVQKNFSIGIRRMVIGIPSGITEVEKRAVRDSAEHAGSREVYLVSEPMAAAIGLDLDVDNSYGNMIVDIGGGTSDIAVISLSGIATGESIRVAGNEITHAIVEHFRRAYNLAIGEKTAEEIKKKIGSADDLDEELIVTVKGRNLVSSLPEQIEASSSEIREAINEPISQIISAIKRCLEKVPPELSADILDRGIMLTGGGALIKQIDKRITKETRLATYISESPLTAVVRGVGKVVENIEKYRSVIFRARR